MKFVKYYSPFKMLLLYIALLIANTALAQESRSSDLFRSLKNRDSLLFDVGFNQCDLSPYDTLISNDLEFYHDKGGITIGKEAFLTTTRNNICNGNVKPKRELVDSSLKVFPLYSSGMLYGAIQQGMHLFYIKDAGEWKYTGAAIFTHLWLLDQGRWRLKRVLSYDH